jgi:hypothetical protein
MTKFSERKTAKLYLDDLSVEQLKTLFEIDPQYFFYHRPSFVVHYYPEWVARYKPEFMVENFPKYMLEKHLDWVCFNKPTLALSFEFEYLLNKNPAWVVKHAQEYLAYSHPELLQDHDVQDYKKYRTDETSYKKPSLWKKIKSKFGQREAVLRSNPELSAALTTKLSSLDNTGQGGLLI